MATGKPNGTDDVMSSGLTPIVPSGAFGTTLDRDGPLYHAIYTRINSQVKELGIERSNVHNGHSVANLNTLIYLVMNVRALERAKSMNKRLLPMSS